MTNNECLTQLPMILHPVPSPAPAVTHKPCFSFPFILFAVCSPAPAATHKPSHMLLALHAAPDLSWRVAIRQFPHPSLETESTIGRVAPVFIMASLMFNVVMLLQNVVRCGGRSCSTRWSLSWVLGASIA